MQKDHLQPQWPSNKAKSVHWQYTEYVGNILKRSVHTAHCNPGGTKKKKKKVPQGDPQKLSFLVGFFCVWEPFVKYGFR